MDKGSQVALTLERTMHGGFLVSVPPPYQGVVQYVFSCTTIDEALKFMRDAINPIPPQSGTLKGCHDLTGKWIPSIDANS